MNHQKNQYFTQVNVPLIIEEVEEDFKVVEIEDIIVIIIKERINQLIL